MRMISGLEDTQLREVFIKLVEAMQSADLNIVDNDHIQTMEVHLNDPAYAKYAFASIQCCSGKYVELRFPRRHLNALGMVDGVNQLGGNVWRNDSKDFIRFRFYRLTKEGAQFIDEVSYYLKKHLSKTLHDIPILINF